MHDRLSGRLRWVRLHRRAAAAALVALAAAGALATPAGARLVRGGLVALGALQLPQWVHNLADLLQIATALIALLAWEAARRGRQ